MRKVRASHVALRENIVRGDARQRCHRKRAYLSLAPTYLATSVFS